MIDAEIIGSAFIMGLAGSLHWRIGSHHHAASCKCAPLGESQVHGVESKPDAFGAVRASCEAVSAGDRAQKVSGVITTSLARSSISPAMK